MFWFGAHYDRFYLMYRSREEENGETTAFINTYDKAPIWRRSGGDRGTYRLPEMWGVKTDHDRARLFNNLECEGVDLKYVHTYAREIDTRNWLVA